MRAQSEVLAWPLYERTNERTNGVAAVSGVDYHLVLIDARAKRDALDRLIAALETLAGVPPTPMLSAVPQAKDPPQEQRTQRTRPQRPAPQATNGAGQHDKVLDALKNGPRAPFAIRAVTGLSEVQLNSRLKKLVSQKKILRLGTGPRNRQYRLA